MYLLTYLITPLKTIKINLKNKYFIFKKGQSCRQFLVATNVYLDLKLLTISLSSKLVDLRWRTAPTAEVALEYKIPGGFSWRWPDSTFYKTATYQSFLPCWRNAVRFPYLSILRRPDSDGSLLYATSQKGPHVTAGGAFTDLTSLYGKLWRRFEDEITGEGKN